MEGEIIDIDQILLECENFADITKKIPRKVWVSTPRRGKKFHIYESLMPKIKSAEETLRNSLSGTIENNYKLILESRALEARLMYSISHHLEFLKSFDKVLTDVKALFRKVCTELSFVRSTISFNEELGPSQGKMLMHNVRNRPHIERLRQGEEELLEDPDHTGLLVREDELRRMKEKLSIILENLQETKRRKLDVCEGIKVAHSILTKAFLDCEGDIPKPTPKKRASPSSSWDQAMVFEDADLPIAMVTDCDHRLRALSGEVMEITRRLAMLVQMREAVRERGEQLDFVHPEGQGHGHGHGQGQETEGGWRSSVKEKTIGIDASNCLPHPGSSKLSDNSNSNSLSTETSPRSLHTDDTVGGRVSTASATATSLSTPEPKFSSFSIDSSAVSSFRSSSPASNSSSSSSSSSSVWNRMRSSVRGMLKSKSMTSSSTGSDSNNNSNFRYEDEDSDSPEDGALSSSPGTDKSSSERIPSSSSCSSSSPQSPSPSQSQRQPETETEVEYRNY
eukprot:gene6088-12285_t